MHETGFKSALTRVVNAYGQKIGVLKPDEKLSGEDCREGITAVISVKLTEPQFEGQTKAKLGNSEMRALVDSVVSDKLEQIFEENPSLGRMIQQAQTAFLIYPWAFWPPVAISSAITIILYVLGQNLADASDPRTHMQ